jgi:hypothetical protein
VELRVQVEHQGQVVPQVKMEFLVDRICSLIIR